MGLTVRVRPGDQGTVVQVGGDLDFEDGDSFQAILLHVMGAYSPRLLLDLAGVSFMDCAGLRALLVTRRRAEMRKGSVRLVAASATVRRVITAIGMSDMLPVNGPGETAASVQQEAFRLIVDVPFLCPHGAGLMSARGLVKALAGVRSTSANARAANNPLCRAVAKSFRTARER